MGFRALAIIGVACGLAACSPPAEQPGADAGGAGSGGALASSIQPGQYRTTVTMLEMSIPGVDSTSINMEPTTTEDCVTSTDVSEFTSGSMVDPDSGETCTQSNMNTGGGRIQGEANCTGPNGARTMQISGTYSSNRVDMEISSTQNMPGAGATTMRMRMASERIGECPAGDTAQ
ncbi:MAG: DUF3617 domain-containing protein [Hyphomonadaceae bacterium]